MISEKKERGRGDSCSSYLRTFVHSLQTRDVLLLLIVMSPWVRAGLWGLVLLVPAQVERRGVSTSVLIVLTD